MRFLTFFLAAILICAAAGLVWFLNMVTVPHH
jgi:hypothetical protein